MPTAARSACRRRPTAPCAAPAPAGCGSRRREHDPEKLADFSDKIIGPTKHLERNRESIRSDFAPVQVAATSPLPTHASLRLAEPEGPALASAAVRSLSACV